MKRLVLILCFWLVGIALAYPNQYPPISPENVANLQEVGIFGEGISGTTHLWSEDSRIFSGANDGFYIYEDLQTAPAFVETGMDTLSFLLAGDIYFFANREGLHAYHMLRQQLIYSVRGERALAVSHDGTMLAYAMDMSVGVLEISTGQLLYELDYNGILESEDRVINEYVTNDNRFIFAQFYPDDSGLVVRWVNDMGYRGQDFGEAGSDFWDFADLSREAADERYPNLRDYESQHSSYGTSFTALDSNGEYFALTGGGIVRAGEYIALDFPEHTYISPDDERSGNDYVLHGDLIAVPVEANTEPYSYHDSSAVVNVVTGEIVQRFEADGNKAFSTDGSKLAIGREVFDIATGERLAVLQVDWYALLRLSPERILHRSFDDRVELIDAASLEIIAELPIRSSEWNFREARGKLVFTATCNCEMIVFDAATGQELSRIEDETRSLYNAVISPDGFFMAHRDYPREIFELDTGESIALPANLELNYPYFEPNGAALLYDTQNHDELILFDVASQTILTTFSNELEYEGDEFVRFSPNGRYLLLGEWYDVNIWDVESHTIINYIVPNLTQLHISPNSRYLVYLADLQTIVFFDLLENREIRRIEVDYREYYLAFRTNEVLEIFNYRDESVHAIYDVSTGEEMDAVPLIIVLFAESNGLRFFHDSDAIWIDDNEHSLFEMHFDYLGEARLSSDGNRIYLNLGNGKVSIWGVGQ